MSWKITSHISVAAALMFTAAAGAYTTNLYDSLGGIGYFGNIGDSDGDYPILTGTTGQQFNASNPALSFAIPATAMIDRVAMRIAIDPNMPNLGDPGSFQFKLRLWTWQGSLDATMNPSNPPIADSGTLTWPGGFDGWVQLPCPPQPASGTYFVAVTRLNLAINGQWRVSRTANSSAVDSVCYRHGDATDTRELQIQLHWYDPSCASTAVTTVTGLAGKNALTGTSPVMTLTGTNLDLLTSASIVRRHSIGGASAPISGALQAATPGMTSRQVTFNLTGAEGGLYDLALASACDRIANAYDGVVNDATLIPLKNAVLVYMPALTNGSFEDAWDDTAAGGFCSVPRVKDQQEAKHWGLSAEMSGISGGQWKRDGSQWIPGCLDGLPDGGDGIHYASVIVAPGSGFPTRNTAFQTFVPPNLVGQVAQKGTVFHVSYHLGLASDQLVLRLRDGGPSGPVIPGAEAILPYTGAAPLEEGPTVTLESGYTFTSNPPLLTVEVQADQNTGGVHGHHFDNLRTTVGCNLPFADADGDHDVDMVDFAVWQRCYSPMTGIPAEPGYCSCFEQVVNDHIDEADLANFLKCGTGSDVTWVQCDP